METKNIDSLLKILAEALSVIERGGDADFYVLVIKKWLEDNAPEYLHK